MSLEIAVVTDSGTRRFGRADLPLRIATGTGAPVSIPGPASPHALAALDVLDDEPFIQPGGATTAVTLNGEPLEASRRLRDGDLLEAYGTRIAVTLDAGRLTLTLGRDESRYITAPPLLEPAGVETAEEEIAPIAYRRRELEAVPPRRRGIPTHTMRCPGRSGSVA